MPVGRDAGDDLLKTLEVIAVNVEFETFEDIRNTLLAVNGLSRMVELYLDQDMISLEPVKAALEVITKRTLEAVDKMEEAGKA